MKPTYLLIAAAASLAISGCNAERGGNSTATVEGGNAPSQPVKPPADGDWSTIVQATPQGGFVMGNPNAKVKLVEFGSLTCPHCAEFDEKGAQPLIENYVKNGNVSWEFRNFVRDPFDITASLIARCNGAQSVFPLTRALYESQQTWIGNIQAAPEAEVQAATSAGGGQQFLALAKLADLQKWAAQRGVPTAKSAQCLTNQQSIDQLVQMNSDITSQYPEFKGTPSFTINGKLLDRTATWEALEPQLRSAVGG